MKMENFKIILILAAIGFAGTVYAGTLFSDDFNGYASGQLLKTASNGLWYSDANCAVMDSNWTGRVFYVNDVNADSLRLTRVDDNDLIIANYDVKVDAYSDPCDTWGIDWYVAGRISGSNWVACGAVLGEMNADTGLFPVYMRLKDSSGMNSGDYLVTSSYFKYLPIQIELKTQGSTLTGTVKHGMSVLTIERTTTVTVAGKPGFGGQCLYGHTRGSFNNFKVESVTPICGDTGTPAFKQGDLNKDCYVDVADTVIFASAWLECTDPTDASCNKYW
jgi:hypothetical protein